MKSLLILTGLLFLYSCGAEAEENDGKKQQNEENTTVDSTETSESEDSNSEEVEDEKEEVVYLEDFAQFASHAELVEHFGKEDLKKSEAWKAEGTVKFPVTIVYPDTKHPLSVYWEADGEEYKNISFVEQNGILYGDDFDYLGVAEKYWKNKVGLEINMDIAALEKVIGPFEFYGLGWDYGGMVSVVKDELMGYSLRLDYNFEESGELPEKYSKISGDILFKSDNSIAREMPVRLVTITYSFEEDI